MKLNPARPITVLVWPSEIIRPNEPWINAIHPLRLDRGLESLGKQRKEFAEGEGPSRAERAGASESLDQVRCRTFLWFLASASRWGEQPVPLCGDPCEPFKPGAPASLPACFFDLMFEVECLAESKRSEDW